MSLKNVEHISCSDLLRIFMVWEFSRNTSFKNIEDIYNDAYISCSDLLEKEIHYFMLQ